jgi:carboxylate-amine ligase
MFELGVEEEFFIVADSETILEPLYGIEIIQKNTPAELSPYIDKELYQCMIELRTTKCDSVLKLREDLKLKRALLKEIASNSGASILGIGAFPLNYIDGLQLTKNKNYEEAAQELPWVIGKVAVCGQHVHVGLDDIGQMVKACNGIRQYIPELIALAVNSPFWQGHLSGLKSTRRKLFEILPISGIPPYFEDPSEFDLFLSELKNAGILKQPSELRWDVRPSLKYRTLEFRMFDVQFDINTSVALAALAQALTAFIITNNPKLRERSSYAETVLAHNCWRAAKDGLNASFFDLDKHQTISIHERIQSIVDSLQSISHQLGVNSSLDYLYKLASNQYTSADKLIDIYRTQGIVSAINQARI